MICATSPAAEEKLDTLSQAAAAYRQTKATSTDSSDIDGEKNKLFFSLEDHFFVLPGDSPAQGIVHVTLLVWLCDDTEGKAFGFSADLGN